MSPRTTIKPRKKPVSTNTPKRPKSSHASTPFGSPIVSAGKRRASAGHTRYSSEERPATPMPCLTYEPTKKLKYASDLGHKTGDLIRRILQIERGREMDNEELYEITEFLLSGTVRTRSFSTLTVDNLPFLYNKLSGMIRYNRDIFVAECEEYFDSQLRDLNLIFSRDKEAGTRIIISHYVCHAVKVAKKIAESPNIAAFAEYGLSPCEIPNVGYVHGSLDYAVANVRVEEGDTLENIMLRQADKGGQVLAIEHPIVTILEFKRTSTFKAAASEAELLGQIRALMKQYDGSGRCGVLTDGYNWSIYTMSSDFKMHRSTFIAGTRAHRLDILSILSLLIAGVIPKSATDSVGRERALVLEDFVDENF